MVAIPFSSNSCACSFECRCPVSPGSKSFSRKLFPCSMQYGFASLLAQLTGAPSCDAKVVRCSHRQKMKVYCKSRNTWERLEVKGRGGRVCRGYLAHHFSL